ncbi:MAG: aminotransferase class IV, partial [Bacteroidales bacterium]|nr:aminotransferase class IV [Bacteroidales bacterium]
SILPSITNMSLRTIAEELGLVVERRHVRLDEIDTFDEAGACGTAAVISPIHKIQDRVTGKEYVISKDGKPGPWSIKMREMLMGIQYGEIEDKYGWCTIVDC